MTRHELQKRLEALGEEVKDEHPKVAVILIVTAACIAANMEEVLSKFCKGLAAQFLNNRATRN